MVYSSDQITRKKTRTAKGWQLDQAVSTWFVKNRQAGTLISGLDLSIQAQKLHNNLYVDNPRERHVFLTASDQVTPKTTDNCWSHPLNGVFNGPAANEDEEEENEFLSFTAADLIEAEDKLWSVMNTNQNPISYEADVFSKQTLI